MQSTEEVISPDFLRRLAAVAARETLPRFRLPGAVVNKIAGGFDPVTEADRETEKALRALIRSEYPDHGILGEEFGNEGADAGLVWVIDPIDGTRSFISGIPLWGTLVGLTRDGDAVAGMMAQPFIGELFYATGNGAYYEGQHGQTRLATSATKNLADATLFTTTPAIFEADRRASYDRLEKQVRLARYGTDCYAYCMLAAGQIDCVVEAGLYPYDIVALIPIIEQAGGVVTDWDGGPAENGGGIVAAANSSLHAQIMAFLHGD
ncbi:MULTISPECIES: histidinol-phosphatase [Rhizobium/Agrobacterium group]|uniref:Histidinol-phosphatase n=4 Tax=Rhizobium/Agrobacterium group TaxID=227290 RepID=A8W006_RHIRH|nr:MULTISPECIES: histidinol-phosphatase [Rhizobium/Agrobacterium group]ABW33597.1 rcorf40 [Rhizobium rhizogenes]AQS65495.1 histidinol-phosphatase [Rhizobium rhizogenes]ASK42085.1 histidinol-phosphatase [Rhizobium rhizogenes]MCZ7445866.1 histidinol-phosphatase [Rhizobium rhizogenes]MCZ7472617.1 histidinol-phosphatase [Rhizobium rhizogenes]